MRNSRQWLSPGSLQSSHNMARPGAYPGDEEVGSCLERSLQGRSWIQGPSALNSANQHWKEMEEGVHACFVQTPRPAIIPAWASLSYLSPPASTLLWQSVESPHFSWPLWNLVPFGAMCWKILPAEFSSIYEPQGRWEGRREKKY